MNAIAPYDSSFAKEGYVQRWAEGAELYQKLASLPISKVDESGMRNRYDQLMSRWIDPAHSKNGVRSPETLGPVVDVSEFGNLQSWIRQAETFIYYVDFDQESSKRSYSAPEPIEDFDEDVADSVSQIPGYDQSWHWPWIEGWDDPAQRRAILNPQKSNGTVKKILFAAAVGGAAIWASKRFLGGRKKNPEELTQEEYY